MNIVVCIKSVPGIITSVNISQTGERLEPIARSFFINETDEYALEEALALRNRYGGSVTAVTVGPTSSEEMLQVALAKGADKVLRVDLSSDDPKIISLALAGAIRRMNYDLVLTGLESSDNLSAQVGAATAERLGIPFLFAATRIEMVPGNNLANVTKEIGNAISQVLEIRLPALISIQTGIQPLTYAPLAKVLQAKRRGIDCIKAAEVGMGQEILQARTAWEILEVSQVQRKHMATFITGTPKEIASELVAKMREA